VEVVMTEDQPERHLDQILEILSNGRLDQEIVTRAGEIFTRLAQAEARVHGIEPDQVHFHEVGAVDAIVDVVGALVGLRLMGVESVTASSLPLGTGTVTCRHGLLPVPAPATLELLKDIPVSRSQIGAELVTPTGAAIITALAERFGPSPPLRVEAIGYGAGRRDLKEMPNLLRILIGFTTEEGVKERLQTDRITVLECDLDDMTPELCGPLVDDLLQEGALDACLTPMIMKKGRPAVMLTVLSPFERVDHLSRAIFRFTTTLGIRSYETVRRKLPRRIERVETIWGSVRIKVAEFDGRQRAMPEFEDCLRISREHSVALREVYEDVLRFWEESRDDRTRDGEENRG
jgi:hypothetical protein